MNKISLEVFISQWLPVQVKNKILFYLLKTPHSKGEEAHIHFFRFGEKIYNTHSEQTIEKFLPFRNEDFLKNIINPEITIFKNCVPAELKNQFLNFKKSMKSSVSETDSIRMKNNKYMQIVKCDGTRKTIESARLGMNNLTSFKYVNETEIGNFPCGLLQSEREIIIAHFKPYNNGYTPKYTLHSDINYKIISISPLQFLWRIHNGLISVKEKRELAKINQIVGRSKLKTNEDYIKAFMKL